MGRLQRAKHHVTRFVFYVREGTVSLATPAYTEEINMTLPTMQLSSGDFSRALFKVTTCKGSIMMNKNQAHGAINELAGKVQEKTGKLIGSKEQQVKGIAKQVIGRAELTLGNAQEKAHDAKKTLRDYLRD